MHEKYMKEALQFAELGKGSVHPNPMVGAVIVKDGQIIGRGYHKKLGSSHAEVEAINDAACDLSGSTMYVTLEPCSHYGRTPPCAERIVKEGIKEVYIGSLDPNPLVNGKGVKILKDAGIKVAAGLLDEENEKLNRRFMKYIRSKMPYVIYKSAMTMDGKTQTKTGDSKWITNEKSREYVHGLRSEMNGIMVGVDTVIKDNPHLTNRSGNGRNPIRIIADSTLRIPLNSNVLTDGNKTIIFTTEKCNKDALNQLRKINNVEVVIVDTYKGRVNPVQVMTALGKRGIDGILLEGGPTLAYSMLREELIDEVQFFFAPKLIGGSGNSALSGNGIDIMKDAVCVKDIEYQTFGSDLLMKGVVDYVYRDS